MPHFRVDFLLTLCCRWQDNRQRRLSQSAESLRFHTGRRFSFLFVSFRFFLLIANSRVHTACLDRVERGIRYFWVCRHDYTRCVFAVVRHVWRVFGISSCDVLYSRRIQRDWQLRSYVCVPSSFIIFLLALS